VRRCAAAAKVSNSAPNRVISTPPLTSLCALSALTGVAALLETAANAIGSMPYFSGLAAAPVAIAAELSAAIHSVPPEVRSSASLALPACCSGASVAVRDQCRQRCRCGAAPASRPGHPRLTCHFSACLPRAQPPP
jgi:hypothetical protein